MINKILAFLSILGVGSPLATFDYSFDNQQNIIKQARRANEETGEVPIIDLTTPIEDLNNHTDFRTNLSLGKYDNNGKIGCELVYFAEYGYDTTQKDDYNIYFYVVTHGSKSVEVNSTKNYVQLRFQSNSSYSKFALTFVSHSWNERSDNLFIKYKLSNPKSVYTRVDANERIYDVCGIELLFNPSITAKDSEVGVIYRVSGFSANRNNQTESTLTMSYAASETLALDTYTSYYRAPRHVSLEHDFEQDIFYAVFNVPNSLINKYGNLYAVHFVYEKLKANWNYVMNTSDDDYKTFFGSWSTDARSVLMPRTDVDLRDYNFWNLYEALSRDSEKVNGKTYYQHHYDQKDVVFNVDQETYEKRLPQEMINFRYETILRMSDLYGEDFLGSFTHHDITYTIDDLFENISNPNSNYYQKFNGFERFWNWVTGYPVPEDIPALEDLKFLQKIGFTLNENDLESYLIEERDYEGVMKLVNSSLINNAQTFILRFDTNMYASKWAHIGLYEHQNLGYGVKAEHVLDFDIIDVTFRNDNMDYTTIGVVHDPKNIFVSMSPPVKNGWPGWLTILIIILSILLVIGIVYVVLKILPLLKSNRQKVIIKNGTTKKKKKR